MAEKKNFIKLLDTFSTKIHKLTDDELTQRAPQDSKNKKLQEEINNRESERKRFLRHHFQDFLEPRTHDIEEDEENLIKTYNFYCSIMEVCEKEKAENPAIQLKSKELITPLCHREEYTKGDEMAFLRLWFLQTFPQAGLIPDFSTTDKKQYYMIFTDRELWTPSTLEKEILQAIDEADNSL